MDAGTAALLAGAGLGAGAVNAVAGGGSLISFPALLAAGYPSITANVTNAIAVLPGYLGGSLAYRRELGGQGARIRSLALTSAAGAAAGACAAARRPRERLRGGRAMAVLAACALLGVQPRVAAIIRGRRSRSPLALHGVLFAAAVYGGYFGAGLGIMLLAILGVFVDDDVQRLNALKGVLSLLVGVVTAIGFALFGPVAWEAAAVVGARLLAGGALGVSAARRLSAPLLRGVVIAYGVTVAIVLLV